jgi:MFS transporter, DHA1 family, multidrug resistance protein
MILGTLALFVVSLGYGVIVPLLPELAGAGDPSSARMISIVYAAYAAAKIGAQIPGGVLVDRRGPDRVLRVALVLFTLSLAGFLFRTDLVSFALLRAVEGLATGLVYPAVFARVLQGRSEQGSGKRIGLVVGIGTSGLLAGPALGGALAGLGPRVPVAVASAAALLVTLAAFLIRSADDRRSAPASTRTVRDELRFILGLATSLGFIGLMLPIAFNKVTFSAFQGLLPLYGPAQLGLGTRGVTALFALTGVCFGVAQGVGGWLADRVDPRRVVLATTLPLLGALSVLAWREEVTVFTVAYAAYICCSSIIFTATMKHAARVHGTDDTYGGVFGVLGTLTDLMTIAGPLLFLNVYGVDARAVFPAMAVAGIMFAAGYVWLGRGASQRAPASAVPLRPSP